MAERQPAQALDEMSIINPGGSMFTPESLEDKLDEVVTVTRRKYAEDLHEGIMEVTSNMQEQFDANETMLVDLEKENAVLRKKLHDVGS